VVLHQLLLATAALAVSTPQSALPHRVISATGHEEAMIIALPGAAETARGYCNLFSGGRYRRLAEQRGYLLVCLTSYGLSMRTENEERRLLALRDELVAQHPGIRKVFLTGYSVGGRGALLVGLRHPEKFDGVAAIVPWMRLPGDRQKTLPEIKRRLRTYPHGVFVAFATFDLFFPVSLRDQASLVKAGEGSLRRRRYFTDHWFVVANSAQDMFDFFDEARGRDSISVAGGGH
jgi:pimeloyl-ACP methyl ester carboxylesterase